MSLYLDTEFNGFGGRLISMGLVSDVDGEEFYEVLPLPSKVHPWVNEHVVPFLVKDSVSDHVFDHRLIHFLRKHDAEIIYADWPADFVYLLDRLYSDNGFMFPVFPCFQLVNSGKLQSAVPHNALSDARALMEWHCVNR